MNPHRSDHHPQPGPGTQHQPAMELPQNILMERLLALLRASDEMMKSVFHHNRQGTLDMLARSVKELLAAEAAAIFLVDEDSPDELVLSAYELDKPVRLRKVRLKIQDVPHGGMTGYIAYTGEIIRLHGEELRGHQNNAHSSTEHLISGVGFSTLGIPLKDRKGRVLGIAKVDNKKGPDGAACEEAFFDEVDEFVARILLNKIVLVLETLCNFDAIRTLMEAMRRAGKLEDLLDEILKTGVRLIGADRGDFVRWDEHRRQLVPAAQYGGEKPEHDQVWPERSVVDEVWRTQESALISDVRSDPKYRDIYYEIQPSTRSEIAVCLVSEGKTVGVLNAESSKVDWFDAHDLELLRLLAQYATIATKVIGKEVAFRGIVRRLSERSPSREQVLDGILTSLASIFGFDAGVIFIADYERDRLQGAASIGCAELEIDPKEYSYHLGDTALTTKVLREGRGGFSEHPETDPEVNKGGLRAFKINSPLVGVPLIYGDKPVGVLVSWSRRDNHPTERHIEELEPFASLAATIIAVSETERQRTKVLLRIRAILNQLQNEMPLRKTLDLLLLGIHEAGFDRARVFEFKEDGKSFVCLASLGAGKSKAGEGYAVLLEKNPYARRTARSWSLDGSLDMRAALLNSSMFGPDPDGEQLGKDPELPWAVVPLVTNGRLYGYIEAENGQTRREITEDNLEYLTLYGSLAGQVIANRHTIDMLRAIKIKDDFLQRMAHIFITNSASMKLMVKNLEDGAVTLPQFQHYLLPGIIKINKNLVAMGEKVRDFAELGEDTRLNIRLVDVADVAREAIERLQGPAQERGVKFRIDPPFAPVLGTLDAKRAARAVEALLENAVKFSPKGKTVYVRVWADEKGASVTVRDEGAGIPENEKGFIFDSFYRATNARNLHTEGSGLGLSIVQRTMDLHEGETRVRNVEGGGAEFTLAFPRKELEHKLDR